MKKRVSRNHFGVYLGKRRKHFNITQEGIAKKLGYSTAQFVSNWERGMADPPKNEMLKIIKILKVKQSVALELLVRQDTERWSKLLRFKG